MPQLHDSLVRLTVIAMLAVGASAQATIVVDIGGSGQFTDLPAAAAAAAPGDLLLVMPGAYTPPTITKPLRIVGEPSFWLTTGTMSIANIAAGQSVSVANLRTVFGPWEISLRVRDCSGFVHLQSVSINVAALPVFGFAALHVSNCRHVSVNEGRFHGVPAVLVEDNSTLVMTETTCTGYSFAGLGPPIHGIEANQSDIYLDQCDVTGGDGYSILLAERRRGDGIATTSGSLYINGTSQTRIRPGGVHPQSLALPLPGHAVVPRGTFSCINPVIPNLTFPPSHTPPFYRPLPGLQANSTTPGGSIFTRLRLYESGSAALAMTLPSINYSVGSVSFLNEYFLDNATFFLLYAQPVTAGQTIPWSVSVPNIAGLRGTALAFQGFFDDGMGTQRFSTPAIAVVE